MPFLTLGGNTIPIASDGVSHEVEETGSRARMFDASMLETVRARKLKVGLVTPPVPRATAETYRGYLVATPPIVGNGDLFNNVATNCYVQYEGMTPVAVPGGARWRVRFTVYEA